MSEKRGNVKDVFVSFAKPLRRELGDDLKARESRSRSGKDWKFKPKPQTNSSIHLRSLNSFYNKILGTQKEQKPSQIWEKPRVGLPAATDSFLRIFYYLWLIKSGFLFGKRPRNPPDVRNTGLKIHLVPSQSKSTSWGRSRGMRISSIPGKFAFK